MRQRSAGFKDKALSFEQENIDKIKTMFLFGVEQNTTECLNEK